MQVVFSKRAEKDFLKLNPLLRKRISTKLKYYANMPDPLRYAKVLKNFPGAGQYRFQIGEYRVVFDIVNEVIGVLYIEHRKDVYRGKG